MDGTTGSAAAPPPDSRPRAGRAPAGLGDAPLRVLADCLCVLHTTRFSFLFFFFPFPFPFLTLLSMSVPHIAFSFCFIFPGSSLHGIQGYGVGYCCISMGGVRSSWSVGSVAVQRIRITVSGFPHIFFFGGLVSGGVLLSASFSSLVFCWFNLHGMGGATAVLLVLCLIVRIAFGCIYQLMLSYFTGRISHLRSSSFRPVCPPAIPAIPPPQHTLRVLPNDSRTDLVRLRQCPRSIPCQPRQTYRLVSLTEISRPFPARPTARLVLPCIYTWPLHSMTPCG